MIVYLQIFNTICLMIVALGCVSYLATKVDRHSCNFERYGFIFTGAGAFGTGIYTWWPRFESFPFPLMMHVGMAMIAASILPGELRGWASNFPSLKWTERRANVDK